MAKHKLIAIILASSFSITFNSSTNLAQTASPNQKRLNPIKIGVVRNRDSFDEAGCSLQISADYKKHNERYIFLSDYEDNAVMNIDGKDTNLKLVRRREPKGDPKKGDRSTWNYSAKGTTVRVDFLVTGVCDPNDESCEVTYYDATIAVTRGNDKQVVKANGLCGS
jgi:hypothetical protein